MSSLQKFGIDGRYHHVKNICLFGFGFERTKNRSKNSNGYMQLNMDGKYSEFEAKV